MITDFILAITDFIQTITDFILISTDIISLTFDIILTKQKKGDSEWLPPFNIIT